MSDEIQPGLFGDDPEAGEALAGATVEQAPVAGVRRVLWPNRTQIELRPCDLDSLLPEGHRARLVWAWVERADLSAIYAGIRAVEGGSGRSAIAPEILFALWLYATLEGVGSARALARLTQSTTPTAGSAAGYRSTTTPSRTFAVLMARSSTGCSPPAWRCSWPRGW